MEQLGFENNSITFKKIEFINFSTSKFGGFLGFQVGNKIILEEFHFLKSNFKIETGLIYFENQNLIYLYSCKFNEIKGEIKGDFIEIIFKNNIRN